MSISNARNVNFFSEYQYCGSLGCDAPYLFTCVPTFEWNLSELVVEANLEAACSSERLVNIR